MGLGEGIAWSLFATQNLYLLTSRLSETFAQFIVVIGALFVAIAIALSMNTPDFNTGKKFLGGLLSGLIAGGFLYWKYRKIHNNKK